MKVQLTFMLTKAQRLFLVVRGPVPSCEVAGVIPVRARRGVNKLTFAGRVGGRALRPGKYLLSLSTTREPVATAPSTLVRVVSKRRSVPAKPGAEKPRCKAAPASTTGVFYPLLSGVATLSGSTGAETSRADAVSAVPPAKSDLTDLQEDVLGIATPGARLEPGSAADRLGSLVAILVLTLIGAVLLTTVALVARFLRGSWNP